MVYLDVGDGNVLNASRDLRTDRQPVRNCTRDIIHHNVPCWSVTCVYEGLIMHLRACKSTSSRFKMSWCQVAIAALHHH
eukprot:12817176-Ditylum_brightwellii.AAC.1